MREIHRLRSDPNVAGRHTRERLGSTHSRLAEKDDGDDVHRYLQSIISKEIHNVDAREYLTFFCLGNKEVKVPGEYTPPEHPELHTDYS